MTRPLKTGYRDDAGPFSFEHGLWQRFTVFDGLVGMRIEDICQDRQGYVWIATSDGGVSRFDGEHFDNLGMKDGLPHHAVMGVTQSEDGAMWFATLGAGLARRSEAGSWRVLTTRDGLPSDEVLGVEAAGADAVRVFTRAGLCRVEEEAVTESVTLVGERPSGPVRGAVQDGEGTTWLATWDHGVVSLAGDRLLDRARLDLGSAPTPEHVWGVCADGEGCIWVAAHYVAAGLWVYRYDPRANRLEAVRADSDLDETTTDFGVRQVRADRRGWVWALHARVMARTGQGWEELRLPEELKGTANLVAGFEDREGNVWLGTWGSGVAVCDPESLERYSTEDGLPSNVVTSLARDEEGVLWVGTSDGLACMGEDGNVRAAPKGEHGWPTGPVFCVSRQQDRIWAGFTDGQVARWDGKDVTVTRLSDTDDEVAALCVDALGQLWASVARRCWGRIEGDALVEQGVGTSSVGAMAAEAAGDGLWLGERGFTPALYRFDEHGLKCEAELGRVVYFVNAICCSHRRPEIVWAGTDCGLLMRGRKGWEALTVDDGLAQNTVLALTETPDGEGLWIGTSGGGACLWDGAGVRTVRLGASVEENVVTAVDAGESTVWLGTRAGLAVYHIGRHPPPSVVVRQVTAGRTWQEPRRVRLSTADGELRIVCQGIGYRSRGRQMRYSFRMRGQGQKAAGWTAFQAARVASYEGLEPGEYRFEARAMDRDGGVSEPARLEIEVVPDPRDERIGALESVLSTSHGQVVATSPAMREVLREVEALARAPESVMVLIRGETGTGKGVVARLLHERSERREGAFVEVNCGGIPEGLTESELFGHVRGAFTGAEARRVGKLELAQDGTVFLDEVGEIPLPQQAALLKVLDQRKVTPVGSNDEVAIAARIVAATNRDLERAVEEGNFRQDLYYRLKAYEIRLPPLRARIDEIPALVETFLSRLAREMGRPVNGISAEATELLQSYRWPGNVRELEHVVQHAVLVCRGATIETQDLPEEILRAAASAGKELGLQEELEAFERGRLVEALEACGWQVYGEGGAAARLKMNPERLRSRMRKLGLTRPGR